ncbi:hypothetical protein J3R83DRAFT_3631 [Lanmaoa asiatica]|nr:hypothetical protein J3R83DRAFT_3631 [Lanmaoa asiatica]
MPRSFSSESSANQPATIPDTSPSALHQEKPIQSKFEPKSYPVPASQPDSLEPAQGWVDKDSTASLPLSQSFDNILPVAASLSEPSTSPESPSSVDPTKRRPLPTPPSILQHSPSSSHFSIPSSPPPPYSTFLPAEDPAPMTRDLSRVSSTMHSTPPEAPVIMPPLPNEQGAQGRAPYDSFLCHSPPANTWIAVETSELAYSLLVRLPGFRRDGITIATRRRRILHVVADSWEPEGGHFERRVSFGYDAELARVRAEFDGEMLRIVVPRRISLFDP